MDKTDIPEKIGRYKPIRLLGRGGMGVVWLAVDPFIGRSVAIKATLTPPPSDPGELEQFNNDFFREAHGAGRLSHPNIVYVYDATVNKDSCYLVLEYVDGPTLNKFCRRGKKLPVKTVINIIFQCAKALYYAHSNGVIHRDIKPANIMIDRKKKQAKITDFGIAALEGLSRLEKKDQRALTIQYASPEQLTGKPLNAQTDIFSLGVVMYELLTGARPFEAETEIATVYKITNEPPTPIKKFREDLPEVLEKIVYKALEKELTSRYQDCRELAVELSQYFTDLTQTEKEISLAEKHHALKRIEFFRDFTPGELDEVAGFTHWVDFSDRQVIITEGDIQDFFFIIISGQVRIHKKDKTLAKLGPGTFFGEMAYLGKTKRTAHVEAVGPTVLMRLDPSVIDQASVNTQLRFCKIFNKALIQRLAQTSELVVREL